MTNDIPLELARQELVRLERRLAVEGAPAYTELLHHDALVIVPGAVMNKDECVAAIEASAGWDKVEISPFWYFGTADTATIAYRFTGSRGTDGYQAVLVSSYLLDNGLPLLIHHQQTPEPA